MIRKATCRLAVLLETA